MKRFIKRSYLKTLIWWRHKNKKVLEFDSDHQKVAIAFVERMLRDSSSKLVFTTDSGSNSYYIENESEDVYITINKKFISITGSSNYDVIIYDKMYETLKSKYHERTEKDKQILKDKIDERRRKIMSNIYKTYTEKESNGGD